MGFGGSAGGGFFAAAAAADGGGGGGGLPPRLAANCSSLREDDRSPSAWRRLRNWRSSPVSGANSV